MSNKQMTASTSVRIRMDDVKVFGPGIAELLERIDRCESIRRRRLHPDAGGAFPVGALPPVGGRLQSLCQGPPG